MKFSREWIITNVFLVCAFIFITWLLFYIPLPTKDAENFLFIFRVIMSGMAFLIGIMVVFDVAYGNMFYRHIDVNLPHKDFEVREYKNKAVIAHKNHALDFPLRKNQSQDVKWVRILHYYNIIKIDTSRTVTSYG